MLIEVCLAIVFIATTFTKHDNIAAIVEWVVAFLFTFFILSFIIDLFPAVFTKKHSKRYEKRHPHDMEEASGGETTPYNGANTSGAS